MLSAYLTIDPNEPASGLYVNDTLPWRLAVTWFRTLDAGMNPITIRLTIFPDGRMQFGYLNVGGVAFGLVSVGAPGAYVYAAADFSAGPTSVPPFGYVYEYFDRDAEIRPLLEGLCSSRFSSRAAAEGGVRCAQLSVSVSLWLVKDGCAQEPEGC